MTSPLVRTYNRVLDREYSVLVSEAQRTEHARRRFACHACAAHAFGWWVGVARTCAVCGHKVTSGGMIHA